MTEHQPESPALPGVTRWRTPRTVPGVEREAIRLVLGNLAEAGTWVRSHGQECHYDGTDLLIGTPGDYIRVIPGEWVVRNPDSFWGFGHDVFPAETFAATYEPAETPDAGSPAPVPAERSTEAREPAEDTLDEAAWRAIAADAEWAGTNPRGPTWTRPPHEQVRRLVEGEWRRAGDAEATLAALRAVLLEGGQDAETVRRRALAIVGGEEGAGRG